MRSHPSVLGGSYTRSGALRYHHRLPDLTDQLWTGPGARPCVAMGRMSELRHGGNVYAAARALRKRVGDLVDFSASINPLGPSPGAIHAITHAEPLLRHYPDPDCRELRQRLASRWRCAADRIVVGNGSIELIHLLPAALQLRHLLVIGPTFSEYAASMTKSGRRVSLVLADRAEGYRPPLARVMKLLRATRT